MAKFGDRYKDSISYDRLLEEISRVPVMTREEEREAFVKLRAGDRSQEERIVSANMRFVASIARNYKGQGLPMEDLVQEGAMGLHEAMKDFDHTMGVKLVSFAVWRIRMRMQRAIGLGSGPVCYLQNQFNFFRKATEAIKRLNERGIKDPTAREIAEEADIPVGNAETTLIMRNHHERLSMPAFTGTGDRNPMKQDLLIDERTTGDVVDEVLSRDVIERMLKDLTDREAYIIRNYYGLDGITPMNLDQIGKTLGLSRERIRQIRLEAFNKVRQLKGFGYVREAVCA
jgi:RNA polymerase primary sigma factor